MSEDVNILTNIANFDQSPNGHTERIGQFHDYGSAENAANQFQNNEVGKTYEQGFVVGYAQAENFAQDNALMASTLAQSLSGMKAEIETGHRRVVAALLQAAFPSLTNKHMAEEITDFIMSLSSCALGGRIQLRVHTELKPTLEKIVQSISTDDDQATFTIKASKNVSGSAVQASWQGGGATIDIESTIKKLITRIEQD